MTTPLVAQKRRQKALAAFRKKNSVLDEVVKRKRPDTLPLRLSDIAYFQWQSPADGVERFSSVTFYKDENNTEREAAMTGLAALKAMRLAAKSRAASKAVTVADVRREVRAEQLKSRTFANQYSEQAKLARALAEKVKTLEEALARANRDLAKVQPLRGVPKLPGTDKGQES